MTFDTILRNGTIVDGSGRPRFAGDVGVTGGTVTAIGDVGGTGAHEVDATGLIIAPGFIDIHTHLDAQLFWDPLVSPSSNHGFTTVIGGNCGFGFAPMHPEHADYMARLMSVVEGIPLEALRAKVPFDWTTFGEFLARLDGNVGVNVGFLVGHSTLRRLVMGADASARPASAEEIGAMAALLRASLAAGGMGFSSSWTTVHIDEHGLPAPSRLATQAELVALASVVGEFPGTTLEFAPGLLFGERETEAMIAMSLAANRPVNWNVIQIRTNDRALLDRYLAPADMAAARGAKIVALTFPDSTVSWHSLRSGMLYDNFPAWGDVMHLPIAERLVALRDPTVRARLAAGATLAESPFMRLLAKWEDQRVFATFAAENEGLVGRRIGDIASERGCSPFDAFLDIAIADQLNSYVELPCEDDLDELWDARVELWRDQRTLIGGSDAGAHLDVLASQRYPTAVLGKAVRERKLLSLEEAVQMLTDAPARYYGLRGRGRIEVDYAADLVVFDAERIGHGPMAARFDLPGAAMRIYVESEGIERVFVNGSEIIRHDAPTGSLPGVVLRSSDLDTNTLTSV